MSFVDYVFIDYPFSPLLLRASYMAEVTNVASFAVDQMKTPLMRRLARLYLCARLEKRKGAYYGALRYGIPFDPDTDDGNFY